MNKAAAIAENGDVIDIYLADPEIAAARGWVPCPPEVGPGWRLDGGSWVRLPPAPGSLADQQAALIAAINGRRDGVLAAGAPHGGRRFAVDDTGRTDLGGMATTALAVLAGALSWPVNYALGWIALDNIRLPLPAPSDGLALAAAAGSYYAAAVQRARDLKDLVLAAPDAAALAEIDIDTGWGA